VKRWTTVADVGVIGNKLAVDGQAYGGLSHSIGFALSEDYQANKKTANPVGAGIPQIDAIPDDFNIIYVENPRPAGPQGSCGCSENFQSSGHMAVINAINNAIGVRVYELPATPTRSWPASRPRPRARTSSPRPTSWAPIWTKSWSSSRPTPSNGFHGIRTSRTRKGPGCFFAASL
jgi:aldehyde oxidoreductase